MALKSRKFEGGLIHHYDRGSQYSSCEHQESLANNLMISSTSRSGDCWDNAVVKGFFHTLKTELIYHCKYQTREEANQNIFEYIEVFYNRKRRPSIRVSIA